VVTELYNERGLHMEQKEMKFH